MIPDTPRGTWVTTDVPGRLDALGWSRWHQRLILALGITWILDGLEASLVANVAPTLRHPDALGLSATEVGLANSVVPARPGGRRMVFGHLTDRLGRKRLFLITLALYLGATALSGLAPGFAVFLVLPSAGGRRHRRRVLRHQLRDRRDDARAPAGTVALAVNGSYWVGVGLGAGVTLIVLDPRLFPIEVGWRVAFGFGALLGLAILLVRRHMPESPRWLLTHGHVQAAIATVERIEAQVYGDGWRVRAEGTSVTVCRVKVSGTVGLRYLAHTLIRRYPRRTILGLVADARAGVPLQLHLLQLWIDPRGVPRRGRPIDVGLYIVPFAIGNFLGPVVLGPSFDRWGRRVMIPLTYALSGVLLLATGGLFVAGALNALTQTLAWMLVFFVASAAASSAYLTVSELFPVELRGMAIAVFYAFGTLAGAGAPVLFGAIVDTGDPRQLLAGYALAAAMMLAAAVVARVFGVDAERRSLEEINAEEPAPLSTMD